MTKLNFSADDILLQLEASDQRDALSKICAHLLAEGKIKPDYEEHLLARESEYPTGLELGELNVAIPHTDWEYSNTTQIVVATLAHPVTWHSMEDSDETLEVGIVILSLFNEPSHQLEALQGIMRVVQAQQSVAEIANAQSPQQVIAVFNK